MTVEERFWSKVDQSAGPAACWPWTAYRTSDGYGRFNVDRRRPEGAHRVAWRFSGGSIPDGFTLDHLCRNRSCCNPAHLDPVTSRINVLRGVGPTAQRARQTHCRQGHPLSGDNLRVDKRGYRSCRRCRTLWQRTADRRKAADRLSSTSLRETDGE
jgi:hypothetical protein